MNANGIVFTPVAVNRGRKFRGRGYAIEGGYTYTRGYSGSGVDPLRSVDYTKIWDPAAKKTAYANAEFVEDDPDATEETRLADLNAYVMSTIEEQIAYCRSKSPSEEDALRWARNSLLKRHPEMRDEIDKTLPDRRDVTKEVTETLRWASGLKTRPCVIYGKVCRGGKPIPEPKKVRIAADALERKGVSKLAGFADVFELVAAGMGMEVPGDVKARLDAVRAQTV